MKLSARNILAGKIHSVTPGAVNSEVTFTMPGGETITAIITNASAESLALTPGTPAYAIIKASEVMIGLNIDSSKISARNVLEGEITSIEDGAVNSEVEIKLPGNATVVASITKSSTHRLNLAPGTKVSAIIKASNVLIGV